VKITALFSVNGFVYIVDCKLIFLRFYVKQNRVANIKFYNPFYSVEQRTT